MENDQKLSPSKAPQVIDDTEGRGNEMDANLTGEDLQVLDNLETAPDSDDANRVYLDSVDDDGTGLNERSSRSAESGDDLDVPGSELDDADEAIGEEDEENNSYSQADTD